MPITQAEAQAATLAFTRDYPGALELIYHFRESTGELYGHRAAEVPADLKGGYLSKEQIHNGRSYRGRVDVPLGNMDDAADLLVTLRHEVLGHYGANTFAPAEKRALLDGIIAAREQPGMKDRWEDINRRYAGTSMDVRAEEVWALHCETLAPGQHVGQAHVRERGEQSFMETCIARVRPMQSADLHNIVCMVADGLHARSRTQQTFPQINELFRRDETMEPKKPFHEVVAEKLTEQLKAGTAPWQRPWEPGEPNAYLPMNPTTGKRYKGINAIHLMAQGRSDGRWMTYKQTEKGRAYDTAIKHYTKGGGNEKDGRAMLDDNIRRFDVKNLPAALVHGGFATPATADRLAAALHGIEQPKAAQRAASGERQFINVPFKEKDEAKQLGARWDRKEQSWYVPAGVDAAPFAKWAQGAATAAVEPRKAQEVPQAHAGGQKAATAPQEARQYLAVPYEQRNAAKAAGALWDKAAKSWYAGPRADMAKLERWKPENVQAQQGPAMTPREEFAEAMRSAGLFTGSNAQGDHPIMDGKRHRVPVEGGKKGALDGFYVGHLDGHPAGRIINNKTGTDITWKSKGYALSDQEKAKLQAEAAEKLAQRAAEQDKLQEATAQRVGRQMADLVPVEQPTPYLQAKGIEAHAGVFTDREGQKTYIPAFDADGKQWTMQYIQEDGTKRFAKDSKKEGCFHPVGGMDALAAAPALVISEGYATAASLAEGLGHATVAAFDSGNLPHVARALREKFPDKPIVIAGDDDKAQEIERGHNPGRAKAEEAAKAVGGKAIFPIFAPGEQQANPKGFTDFNDLANKSELGRDGLKRQVGAAVGQVLIEEGRRQQQEQRQERAEKQQQQPERPRRAARIG